ncbi:MAG: 50S ribosomal protein L22 [Thermoproteota archaeon]|nr:MAG: 50S ribosomal protein L22 [Candidatus Korarchaeota archaeon]RLG55200.1 MAG: 50S ribosomal protein L22 [Candidatus Korarchaeota archaeon]
MSPSFGYCLPEPGDTEVRVSVRDQRISYKECVELCRFIKGMSVEKARKILEEVIRLKRPVPFKRYVKGVGHRKGLKAPPSGRYPVKASKVLLRLLENGIWSAENKGLDADNLYIKGIAAHKGPKLVRFFPRAFGRATPKIEQLVHIELLLAERKERGEHGEKA